MEKTKVIAPRLAVLLQASFAGRLRLLLEGRVSHLHWSQNRQETC